MAKKKPAAKASRTKRTPKKRTAPDWAGRFLQELARTANIRAACLAAKVGRSTVYQRRDSDPDGFGQQMALALDDAIDDLELEARRRAYEGCTRAVYGSGGIGVGTVEVGEITEYSDTLMIFLLKAHRPAKYREHHVHEHTGRVSLAVEEMSDDDLGRIASSEPGESGS